MSIEWRQRHSNGCIVIHCLQCGVLRPNRRKFQTAGFYSHFEHPSRDFVHVTGNVTEFYQIPKFGPAIIRNGPELIATIFFCNIQEGRRTYSAGVGGKGVVTPLCHLAGGVECVERAAHRTRRSCES
jgi:hypothetical protein